jgi:hypothetical protein
MENLLMAWGTYKRSMVRQPDDFSWPVLVKITWEIGSFVDFQ